MTTIKKSSKLYKFVEFGERTFPYDMYMSTDKTLGDVCTFTRHVIYTIITTVIAIVVLLCIIGGIFGILFYLPYAGFAEDYIFGKVMFFTYITVIIFYLTIVLKRYLESKNVINFDNVSFKPSSDGIIMSTISIVSEKSNKMCKQIKIVDDIDE